jgi:zinc protease
MTKLLPRVAALLALALAFLSCTPTDPKYAISYTEKRGVLESNGLRFVIMPDPSTELVEVDVRYQVGSREDPNGKAGLAHLVEHLMFQLRPDGDTSPPLMQFINQLSTFFNAYTSWDQTHYMTTTRAEEIDGLLKIEAMRMYYGCQTVPEEQFTREREVVRNEIRLRGGNADGQVLPLILEDIYPKDHAYRRMVGGDDRQIASASLQDACDFINKYYVPANATVIIAGGVDYDKTVELIKKWFGKLEKKEVAPRKAVDKVEPNPGKHEYELDIERPYVAVSWPLPASNTQEGRNVRYGIFNAFIRTAQKAQEYDFAYSVDFTTLGGEEAPAFSIIITPKGMGKVGESLDFVWKAARSAHRGYADFTWQEFDNNRKVAKADFIANLEQLAARTNQLGDLVQFEKEVDYGSAEPYIIHELNRYDQFDGEAIAHAIKKYLDPDRATVSIFKPSKEGIKGDVRSKVNFQTKSDQEGTELAEVDPKEAKRPLKVATELKSLEGAIRYDLSNGMHVVLLPVQGSLPIVSAQLVFNAGEVHSGTPGLARAAARFLNPDEEETALSTTGIGIFGYTTSDHTIFETRTINIYLDVMVKGLERLIRAGVYHQEQIERWQKSYREAYGTIEQQSQAEFGRQVYGSIFGVEHPYARNAVVLPDDIKGIGYDELTKFARKHYSAGNATLVIAGNFDADAAKKYVSSAFGGWSKGHVDEPIGPDARERTGAEFIGVVGKEEPTIQMQIAFPAPAGIDGEQGARQVLAEMINSRMGDLRFKLGSTYGAYAAHVNRMGPTMYIMGGTFDAMRAGESLKVMREGLEMLRGTSDQWDIDFVRARRKLIQDLLGESTVSGELAERLSSIARYNLKADYYNTLLKTIAAVSPAQVRSLIDRDLAPDKEIVVIMADKKTVETAFKDAGINDVKIVEPDYK